MKTEILVRKVKRAAAPATPAPAAPAAPRFMHGRISFTVTPGAGGNFTYTASHQNPADAELCSRLLTEVGELLRDMHREYLAPKMPTVKNILTQREDV